MILSRDFLPEDKVIAVGWSGGIDSTAVLLWLKTQGYCVEAWNVDHAWRDESKEELLKLESICSSIGVEFVHARIPEAKSDSNRECVARDARYNQFKEWSESRGVDFICLGHHKADQAETVYMRLLSGSGIHGCSGMKESRSHGLTILRPALDVSKQEMKDYLVNNKVSWIEDPSNNDNSIKRNSVRNTTFPKMIECGISPVDLFSRLAKQASRISEQVRIEVDKVLVENHDGIVRIEAKTWMSLSPLIKKFLLQKMGRSILGDGFSFGRKHLDYAASWSSLHSIDLTKTMLYRDKKHIFLKAS